MLRVLTRFSNGAKKKCNRILGRARRLLWDMPLLSTYNNRATNTMALHTFPLNFFTNEPMQTHTSAPLPEVVVSVCSLDILLAWARGKNRNICYQSSSRKWGEYLVACFPKNKWVTDGEQQLWSEVTQTVDRRKVWFPFGKARFIPFIMLVTAR